MARSPNDDDRFAYDGEDDAIEAEAREVLGDTHVDDVLASYDDRYDAIADLADAVVDEEDRDSNAPDVEAFEDEMHDNFVLTTEAKTAKGIEFGTTGGKIYLRDATTIAAKYGLEPYYVSFGNETIAFCAKDAGD